MNQTAFAFTAVGLGTGLVSCLILAVSLNHLLQALKLVGQAHGVTIQAQAGKGDVPVFLGLEKHVERGSRSASLRTKLGFILLAISFACQFAALFFQ